MVNNLHYNTIALVLDNWETIRRMKNYEEVAGSALFQRFFDKCPEAKVLYGFNVELDAHSLDLVLSKRFLLHASYFIQMVDAALNMLGPDLELLTEIMLDLGAKHVRYGVRPQMFPIMGICLIETVDELCGGISAAEKAAWKETYGALSGDMLRGQKPLSLSKLPSNVSACL